MCRHLGYLGPPVTLAALVLDPPHSLLHQSCEPRMMAVPGIRNGDGYGVGWYAPELRPEPARYRRADAIWTDASFASFAGVVTSGSVLAAIRAATPGFPIEESAAAPFTGGRWLFSMNGYVEGWATAEPRLRQLLPPDTEPESPSDAALLWAILHDWLAAGRSLADAVGDLFAESLAAGGGRLNFLATDGTTLVGTAYGNTLHAKVAPDCVTIASEPLDDDEAWSRIADGSFVVAVPGDCTIRPLPALAAADLAGGTP